MERIQLEVEKREAGSKGDARRTRREGNIPAIVYGIGEPSCVSVDSHDWLLRFRHVTGNTIIELKLGKEKHNVLVKDVQDDLITNRVNHIDFYAIRSGKKLTAMVPIRMEGTPLGVRAGGIVEHKIDELEVECLPKDMPEQFKVDISEMQIGDSLHVGQIEVPEGVEIRTDDSFTIAVVTHSSVDVGEEVVEDEEDETELSEGTEEGKYKQN